MLRKAFRRSLAALSTGALLSIAPSATAISLYFNTPAPPLNTWHSESIPLSSAGDWRVNSFLSGTTATAAQFQHVMQNLVGIFILIEWATGDDDTNVDNIRFGTLPMDTFGSDNGGWTYAGPTPTADIFGTSFSVTPATHDAAFGNPAGSIRQQDGPIWAWVGAPARYLGDQSAQIGNTFDYDIFIRFSTGSAQFPAVALVASDEPLPPIPAPLPAPATLALIGVGLLGLAGSRRRKAAR